MVRAWLWASMHGVWTGRTHAKKKKKKRMQVSVSQIGLSLLLAYSVRLNGKSQLAS